MQISTTLNGQAKTLASSITYLPYGGITGLTYGNSLSLSQGFDNQYRTSSIAVATVLDRTYGYDANGNVITLDDGEAAGNEALETAGVYTYDQDANLLADILRDVPVSYEYDYNANTVSANNRTFIYDSSNQLIQVLDNSNLIGEYTYNGAGQRIKKWTSSGTRIFHYDLRGHLIAETTQAGTMIAEYVYLADQHLAMITKPGETEIVSYFHNDHLGTPQVLTNDSQNVVWKAAYTPFGKAEILTETVTNPFRFPGQCYDQETGLHYNYFRYYDPATGRYVTPDPIGLEGGMNLFGYTMNDPINWIDPNGLLTRPVPGPIRDPDAGALEGGRYGVRRTGGGVNYPHSGVDLLAPVGANVVSPFSGTIESSGPGAVLICRQEGTICCNGVVRPRLICWRLVHISPTINRGSITEGRVVGTVSTQNPPIPPHVHVEYYESTCSGSNTRVTRTDPTPHLPPQR